MNINHKTMLYGVVLVLLFLFLFPACSYRSGFIISSTPQGAKILIDNQDTGKLTPINYKVRWIPLGEHKITVELDGYVVPPAQDIKIVTATGKILATILVPEILVPMELFGRRWKHALPHNRRKSIFRDGYTFELQPEIATIPIPTATIMEE